jgi:hypothetical protein
MIGSDISNQKIIDTNLTALSNFQFIDYLKIILPKTTNLANWLILITKNYNGIYSHNGDKREEFFHLISQTFQNRITDLKIFAIEGFNIEQKLFIVFP